MVCKIIHVLVVSMIVKHGFLLWDINYYCLNIKLSRKYLDIRMTSVGDLSNDKIHDSYTPGYTVMVVK